MNTVKLAAFIIGIFSLFPTLCFGINCRGKVVSVSDGDTLSISDNNENLTGLRLYGINVPKRGQDYYEEAKKMLSAMVKEKVIVCHIVAKDEYGQSIAFVYLNGASINGAMIKAGYALVDTAKCENAVCDKWKDYQKFASQNKEGLWKQSTTFLAGGNGENYPDMSVSSDLDGPMTEDSPKYAPPDSYVKKENAPMLGIPDDRRRQPVAVKHAR